MTMEELNKEAELFLKAGYRYWEDTDGFGVLFSRGEYLSKIIDNIENQGPTRYFGAMKEDA